MKIAVPIFNERITPRFGFTESILIISLKDNEPEEKRIINVKSMNPLKKAVYIKNNDVKVLICLGIEFFIYNYLKSFGIIVLSGVQGNVNDAINLYLKGKLIAGPEPKYGLGMGRRMRHRRGQKKYF